MKKSVALLVSSLSVFALCSNVEGAPKERKGFGFTAAEKATLAKTQAVKPSAEVAKPAEPITRLSAVDASAMTPHSTPEQRTKALFPNTDGILDVLTSNAGKFYEEFRQECDLMLAYKLFSISIENRYKKTPASPEALKVIKICDDIARMFRAQAFETANKIDEALKDITQKSVDLVNILSRLFLYDAALKRSKFEFISSSPGIGQQKRIADIKTEIEEDIRTINTLYKLIEESKFTKIPASSIQDSTGKENVSIKTRIEQISITASKYFNGLRRKSETIIPISDIADLCDICKSMKSKLVDAQN